MRISAALIARDEEAYIRGCLEKLESVVDEIVLVDTGSSDRTPEIAASLGARVLHEPWRDDFAYARNYCLEHVTGDWVLYIDADERIDPTGDFRTPLADPNVVAGRVRFRASSRVTPYWEYRLFRNRPDIRFRGAIHETMMPDVTALVAGGMAIADCPLSITHLGYEGDLTAKHRRNLPLLRRAVKEDPTRIYLWHALGEAELGLGDAAAAERAWRGGLQVIRQSDPDPCGVLIYSNLLDLHFSEPEVTLADALELIEDANRRYPDDLLIAWWTARHLASDGRFSEARSALKRILDHGSDEPYWYPIGYDRQLFNVHSWGLMGVCWLQEGDPQQAVEWFRRAEAADPTNLEISTKRALADHLAGETEALESVPG